MASTSFRRSFRTHTLRLQRALLGLTGFPTMDRYNRGQHAVLRIVSKSTVCGLGFGSLEVSCSGTAVISDMEQAKTREFNL